MFINKPRRLSADFAEPERLEAGAGDSVRNDIHVCENRKYIPLFISYIHIW